MKVTIIGSSHGVPEAHRKCSCIMLEVGECIYFIDMGTPAIDALRTRNLPINAVKGIFITHMHGDHTNGLIQFADLVSWCFKTPDPVIFLPAIEAAEIIEAWLRVNLIQPKQFQYRKVQPGPVFDDGVLKVTAMATQHCRNSYAYLVEGEGKTLLFTGDLKKPAIDFPDVQGRTLDLVVCESAHFQATDYLPVFENCDIRKVCVNHYSDYYLPSVLELCSELNKKGIPALRAKDDMELAI